MSWTCSMLLTICRSKSSVLPKAGCTGLDCERSTPRIERMFVLRWRQQIKSAREAAGHGMERIGRVVPTVIVIVARRR